jgi:hypothetical protein
LYLAAAAIIVTGTYPTVLPFRTSSIAFWAVRRKLTRDADSPGLGIVPDPIVLSEELIR